MQKVFLLIGICIFGMQLLHAQVKVGANATGKHAKAINTAKDAKAQAEARREQLKQVKEQKKAVRKYEKRYKSLKKKKLKTEKDSLKIEIPVFTEQDSIALAERVLNEADFPEEYRDLVLRPISLDSLDVPSIDSSALSTTERLLENQAKNYLPDELSQEAGNPLDALGSNPLEGGLNTPDIGDKPDLSVKKPSKPNPNLVKPEAARDLFKKIDPDQFQKIQSDITKLKKKYSSMPDTRFPEEGRKRNSLEDLAIKKRIYLGGTVNATSTDPLILDTNLQLGYWIHKKWMAGVGLTIREQLNNRDSTSLTGDAHGYSLFTRYDVLKQFYFWGEMQRQVNRSLLNNESVMPARWQESYLLGVGREFKIGPVRMTSLIMYDFNYQSNDLNSRPLVFRLGVQFSKKP